MSAGDLEIFKVVFEKHRSKGLLLDTNVLMLYLAGLTNRDLIKTFKPISSYHYLQNDFDRISDIVSFFTRLATTPHILTEVSNHSDKLKGADRLNFCKVIQLFTAKSDEYCPPSKELSQREYFPKFGLTDTAISEIAPGKFFVLTTDFELAGHLRK
jgi:hypothetical protein